MFGKAWFPEKKYSSCNIPEGICVLFSGRLQRYNQFHEKKERIYEAWNRAEFSGEMHCWNTMPKVLAKAMEKDFPQVEQAVRVN